MKRILASLLLLVVSTCALAQNTIAPGGGVFSGTGSLVGWVNRNTGAEEIFAGAQTLTDAATINWNTNLGAVAIVTLGGNRTIAAPANLKATTYILVLIQDGTGSRVPVWNSVFKWESGIAPTLSTTAGARDILTFISDGVNLYAPGFDVR